MLAIWYERYKPVVWLIMTLAFASGTVSKAVHGTKPEIALNAALAIVSCIVWLTLRRRGRANARLQTEHQ